MKSWLRTLMLLVVLGLGLIGIYSMIVTNPLNLLIKIIIIGAVIGIGLYVFRRFFSPRPNDSSHYRRAVRQSKKIHKSSTGPYKIRPIRHSHLKAVPSITKKRRGPSPLKIRDHAHLTVIEGKKAKKKKRVLF